MTAADTNGDGRPDVWMTDTDGGHRVDRPEAG
jgi:hypothetical protein